MQLSQLRMRLPDFPLFSSWISKHQQVGQAKVHVPQFMHEKDTSSQNGAW
jgi:hypothetical protein